MLAVEVGMEWYYDLVYWSGSQSTHGSAISVEAYVGLAADETPSYKLGLSTDHVHAELSMCCDILIRVLALLGNVLKFDVSKLLEGLNAEYKATFGHGPLDEPEGG